MSTQAKEVMLRGKLRVKYQYFNINSGMIDVKGDVQYDGEKFPNVPIVSVYIRWNDGVVTFIVIFPPTGIPCMTDIREFREILLPHLEKLRKLFYDESSHVLAKGTGLYMDWLRRFRDEISIVRQTKRFIEDNDQDWENDSEMGSEILKAFGWTDRPVWLVSVTSCVRRLVGALAENKEHTVIAREVLGALGRIPSTDIKLIRV